MNSIIFLFINFEFPIIIFKEIKIYKKIYIQYLILVSGKSLIFTNHFYIWEVSDGEAYDLQWKKLHRQWLTSTNMKILWLTPTNMQMLCLTPKTSNIVLVNLNTSFIKYLTITKNQSLYSYDWYSYNLKKKNIYTMFYLHKINNRH